MLPESLSFGVIAGGPGPEHDVSILTALQAERALSQAGTSVRVIYWSKEGEFFDAGVGREAKDFVAGAPVGAEVIRPTLGINGGFYQERRFGKPVRIPLDAALICCHGVPGECGRLQGLLDLMGIPYSGPSQAGAALAMDKFAFASVATTCGVPCIPRLDLSSAEDTQLSALGAPFVLKPRFGGSSIGVVVVADLATARDLAQSSTLYTAGALIEPYLDGWWDVNIAIRSWPKFELSGIERPLRSGGDILSYSDKYVPDGGMAGARRELPAKISSDLEARIHSAAALLARTVLVRGVARLDFMTNGTDLLLNEMNSVPGSLARYLWVEPPRPFYDQLSNLLEEALENPAYRPVLQGADGGLLRGADTVAAKLSG